MITSQQIARSIILFLDLTLGLFPVSERSSIEGRPVAHASWSWRGVAAGLAVAMHACKGARARRSNYAHPPRLFCSSSFLLPAAWTDRSSMIGVRFCFLSFCFFPFDSLVFFFNLLSPHQLKFIHSFTSKCATSATPSS